MFRRHVQRLAVLALMVIGTGCSSPSAYSRLRDEAQVPDLAALKQETLAHANHTTLVETHGISDGGQTLRVAVHQIETPGHDKLLVFLHGVFSDSSAWRFVTGELAADHDLWLVDLPGCGSSDKPDPEVLGPDGYAPPDLAARVLDALRERLAARGGSQHFTVIGHSLGGMVAIRMFADAGVRSRYAEVLDRIDRMVLSAPVDAAVNHQDPMFRELATISPLQVGLGSALGMIRERLAAAILNSVDDPATRALREEADQRVRFLNDRPTRRAMQAMLNSAVAWKGNRPDWARNEAVVQGYPQVRPDCLILWGGRDEVMPASMGYKLAVQIPHAKLVVLPRVMHSPHIEVPKQAAGLIRAFADDGKVPADEELGK